MIELGIGIGLGLGIRLRLRLGFVCLKYLGRSSSSSLFGS
jgi:hypothetical protein